VDSHITLVVKSNIFKFDSRGPLGAWYSSVLPIYRKYFERALACEPPGPRRNQLLAEQAALFPGKGKRNPRYRLRKCHCGRLFQKKNNYWPSRPPWDKLCPGCAHLWRRTDKGRKTAALHNSSRDRQRLARIHKALGNIPKPPPTRCQHGHCVNTKALRMTATDPAKAPLLLCPRHRWQALQQLKQADIRPRPVGRPPSKRVPSPKICP
jgi:hypothetical protein